MRQTIIFITFFCGIFFQSLVAQTKADTLSTVNFDNFHKVDESVYRSGQPNAVNFQWLQDNGFDEVLNLHRYHSDDDEAKGTDIKLHHIKVRASRLNEKHLLEAMRIIQN